jgi:hypothetical protein
MKSYTIFLLIALLVGSNGCMTASSIRHAKAQTHQDDKGAVIVDKKSHPAYYALLPLTVPLDIATCPFQALWICWEHYIIEGLGTTP